jgi:hypothetical protein
MEAARALGNERWFPQGNQLSPRCLLVKTPVLLNNRVSEVNT